MKDRQLHFCMITTFYPPYHFGGDAIYIYRLSNELARRGHHVDIIHCKDSYFLLKTEVPRGEYPNHPNVQVYGLKSKLGFLSPILTHVTGMSLLKRQFIKTKMELNDYDVIHYHNMSLIGITALQYGGNSIKLYTTNEYWLICPTHALCKFNREACRKKICFLCSLAQKRPPQLWRYTPLLGRMLQNVDRFISPSRFTKRKHLEEGLNISLTHIPYFTPRVQKGNIKNASEESYLRSHPYFLFVGRLEKIKGLQNVIPVFKKYVDYDLLVAGDGTYGSRLRRLATGIQNIRFLGTLNNEELQKLYRKALAVIVPSICPETFGLIVIESFSMKTPAIVNNVGALPEIIEDSGAGFVYSNEGELVSAMQKLAKYRNLRKALGERGFQAYLKYWSEDAHLEKYLNLIKQVQRAYNFS